MASNLMASDLLDIDWGERARNILANAGLQESLRNQPKRVPELRIPVRSEPLEIKQKNVFTDPNSWLNRGLEQLGRNAVDAVFGQESGNALVDYGVSNVPGVGAGAILAAGGMPGLVDVTGFGALKNAKKLVKPVKEFILRNAGEEGLQAVDNYLAKFPKIDKLSMADADYLLTSGKLGKKFDVSFPKQEELVSMVNQGMETSMERMRNRYLEAGASDEDMKAISEMFDDMLYRYNSALDKGDLLTAYGVQDTYYSIMGTMQKMYDGVPSNKLREFYNSPKYNEFWKKTMNDLSRNASDINHSLLSSTKPEGVEATRLLNEYFGIQKHPMQDFDKIEASQLRRDAQQAEKAARKTAKDGGTIVEAPTEPGGSIVTVEPEPAGTVVEVPPEPEPVRGGPNKWRENGWTSEEHPIDAYSILSPKATEEDRRAMFVMDSLANEAVSKLIRNNRFKDEWPGASKLRHQGTNYDTKSREYGQDVAWNARTGNLPGNTTSLVLRTAVSSAGNRLPGQMTGVVDGKDLYDLLFRKKVDKKINELDNRYRVEF